MITVLREKRKYIVMYSVFFIIVHGEMIFNKISWHDDVYSLGGWYDGLGHGRFTEYLLTILAKNVSGTESIPLVHSLIAAFCFSICLVVTFEMFDIESTIAKVSLMIIFLSIPAIAGNVGYMCTFGFNAIGILLTFMAAYDAVSYNDIMHSMRAVLLFAFSIGEYQCYITLFLSIMLCAVFKILMGALHSTKEIFGVILKYIAIAIGGVISYMILLQVFLRIFHTELSDYANIDTFGFRGIENYIAQIKQIYKNNLFYKPTGLLFDMFPFHWEGWQTILMTLLFIGGILIIFKLLKEKDWISLILFVVVFAVIPVIFCFNFVIYNMSYTHSLHMYHYVMVFVIVFMLIDEGLAYACNLIRIEKLNNNVGKAGSVVTACFIGLIGCAYVRYDNICYMSAEMEQEQAISYCTTLISDIHNTPGYYGDIPVCYINNVDNKMLSNHTMGMYDSIITNPFNTDIASLESWKAFMYVWCNYKPDSEVWESELDNETLSKVMELPHYPDYGSIKVIDDVLYIRF